MGDREPVRGGLVRLLDRLCGLEDAGRRPIRDKSSGLNDS